MTVLRITGAVGSECQCEQETLFSETQLITRWSRGVRFYQLKILPPCPFTATPQLLSGWLSVQPVASGCLLNQLLGDDKVPMKPSLCLVQYTFTQHWLRRRKTWALPWMLALKWSRQDTAALKGSRGGKHRWQDRAGGPYQEDFSWQLYRDRPQDYPSEQTVVSKSGFVSYRLCDLGQGLSLFVIQPPNLQSTTNIRTSSCCED